MQDTLELPASTPVLAAFTDADTEELDILRRSPHPYHRQNSELHEPSDRLTYKRVAVASRRPEDFTKESTPASESGTEADDEHILKGLPAPRPRRNKGLRGMNEELLSGTSTPLPSPAIKQEDSRRILHSQNERKDHIRTRKRADKSRRRKEVVRRSVEVVLLACLAGLVQTNAEVQSSFALWKKGTYPGCIALYFLLSLPCVVF
jgi:hypothetical protein